MKFAISILLLFTAWSQPAAAQEPPLQVSILVESPIYSLRVDPRRRMASQLVCVVTRESCNRRYATNRNWFTPNDLQPVVLEAADYARSGYDRGHLCALDWFDGSEYWRYTNCTAAIVPMRPMCNRRHVRAVERRVTTIADTYESVNVTVVCEFDDETSLWPLPEADETYEIPIAFIYTLEYTSVTGVELAETATFGHVSTVIEDRTTVEIYRIPNE